MATEFNSEFITYLTPDGAPAAGDLFYFYEVGTNTPKTIYVDVGLTTPRGNPVAADSRGQLPSTWLDGSYRVVRFNKDGVQIKDAPSVGADIASGPLTDWNSAITYDQGDLVQGSNGTYYISLNNGNLGNDPTSDPSNWSEIRFLGVWNTNQTYAIGEVVQTSDGFLWASLTNGNLGNDPSTDSVNWSPAVDSALILLPFNTVVAQTGGGTLTALRNNEFRDGSTYTLPLANSVLTDQTITLSLPDRYSASQPLAQADGGDTITDINGVDTEILFDSGSIEITLTSDGVTNWSL